MMVRTGARTIEVDVVRRNALDPASGQELALVDKWVVDRIAAPDPALGRTGDVCPFVATALRLDTLWYAIVKGADLTAMEMSSVMNSLGVMFDNHRVEAERPSFVTFVVVFPDMPDEVLAGLVLEVHRATKDSIVRRGAMLGEFLPGYGAPGIRNPDFRPLTSPVPLLVIRSMVAGDAVFLADHEEWLAVHASQYPTSFS